MKVIIDIPEDMYESIKQLKIQYPRGSAKTNQLDFYYELFTCIKQGIPLPKGHWIKHHNDNLGRCMRDNLECSVCGKWMCESPYQSFCPSCGAEMERDGD